MEKRVKVEKTKWKDGRGRKEKQLYVGRDEGYQQSSACKDSASVDRWRGCKSGGFYINYLCHSLLPNNNNKNKNNYDF